MAIELADEYFRRHAASQRQLKEADHHPSYREYWHACAPGDKGRWTALPPDRYIVEESELDDYFTNTHATLWGRAWDMSQEESREGAKRWLMGVLTALGIEVEK